MDHSDPTPLNNYVSTNSSLGMSGFALYEAGVDYFKKLGIPQAEIERIPEVGLTALGSLLKQADDDRKSLDKIAKAYTSECNTSARLRQQRDELRDMFQRMGHDPMPGYQSQSMPIPKDLR